MNKFLVLVSVVVLAMLWPFSCMPQSKPPCDPIIVEDPVLRAEIDSLQTMIVDLTAENKLIREDADALREQVATLTTSNEALLQTVSEKNAEIANLRETNQTLSDQLQACLDKPSDTVEVVVEVPVMPEPTIDIIYVSHSNPDKTNRRFFHHGTLDPVYPKYISFETTELCMIQVLFKEELTQVIREADSIQVKRTKDHENAQTLYEFIGL